MLQTTFIIWKVMQVSYLCHIILVICINVLVGGKGPPCAGHRRFQLAGQWNQCRPKLCQSTKLLVPLWKHTSDRAENTRHAEEGKKKERETDVQTPRSDKEGEEVLHGTRTSIHLAVCGRDHPGAAGYFTKELQQSREVWEWRSPLSQLR